MYHITSQAVIDRIESDCRTFRAVLDFGSRQISGAEVGHIRTEHMQSEDDAIQLGGVLSRHAEIKLYTDRLPAKGETFVLYLYLLDWGAASEGTSYSALHHMTHGALSVYTHAQIQTLGAYSDGDGAPLGGELIPMGEFVVSRAKICGIEATLDCYDKLGTDRVYVPHVTFPADSFDVVDDVIGQLGISSRRPVSGGYLKTASGEYFLTASGQKIITGAEYAFTVSEPPSGTTCRELLGWIAAMYGGNGILDRQGRYTTLFVSDDTCKLSSDRINEPDTAEAPVSIKGLRCIVSENTALTVGDLTDPDNPLIVEFDCPYMTQERLAVIWLKLSRIRWTPGSLTERLGDPRRDLGDRLYLPGRGITLLASGAAFTFDGGLQTEITSCGNLEV